MIPRQISITTPNRHRYVFRCIPGDEPRIVNAAAALAANKTSEFNWWDAAQISWLAGRALLETLDATADKILDAEVTKTR